MKHKSLNQLLCAATVNVRFREALLSDPAQAIATGYFDHSFCLTPEEQELVVGIQAQRLEDFAAQIHHWISNAGNGNAYAGSALNGNGRSANGYNGNGHSGSGRNGNGNGHKHESLAPHEGFVELYRAPALAHV
jgi:hypothetical protein